MPTLSQPTLEARASATGLLAANGPLRIDVGSVLLIVGADTLELALLEPAGDPQLLIQQIKSLGFQFIIDNDTKQLAQFRPDIGINGFSTALRNHADSFLPVFS